MNGLPYYKAYPRDFIEGTVGMSFELKGAYRLVLDLIYMQGGALPDDDRYIAGLLSVSVRKWKSIRGQLLGLGKISVSGQFLTNERAIIELENSGKFQDKQSENGSGANKNKGLQKPKQSHTDTDTEATLSSVARAAPPTGDFDFLQSKLLDAVGHGNIQAHSALVVGPIVELVAAGADLELDVLPTLRARAAKMTRPAAGWGYFVQAIRDAYERRIAAGANLPKPKPMATDDAAWLKRLRFARNHQQWSEAEWGPQPRQPGCMVPPHLIDSRDGINWMATVVKRQVAA